MREKYYQRRLKGDLKKWIEQGRISTQSAEDIVRDLPTSGLAERLPMIIAIKGAILISVGLLAFVAANWYGVPKAVRLALLAGGMWTAYGCAGILHRRGSFWLFEAAVLIGVSIYAIAIVLIAQMYHIDGHYPDAIFMAGAGAIVAAWLVRSTAALVIAFGALSLWTSMEVIEFDVAFHWPFPLAWGVAAGLSIMLKSRIGYHLASLSLGWWVGLTIFTQSKIDGVAIALLASLVFLVLTIAFVFRHLKQKDFHDSFARALSLYAVLTLVILSGILQLVEDKSILTYFSKTNTSLFGNLWLLGSAGLVSLGILTIIFWRKKTDYSTIDIFGLVILGVTAPFFGFAGVDNLTSLIALSISLFLISLWLIVYGQSVGDRFFLNLGFVLFGAETLYVYFKTFGTLMNSFVFFTIGGVVLILLALGLDRFRKRMLPSPLEQEVEG